MDLPDVNVLMRAFRTDSYGHDQAVEWLNNALAVVGWLSPLPDDHSDAWTAKLTKRS